MARKRKNGDKDRKALYKFKKNAMYSKTMENVRNRIDIRLVSNEKDYLKWISKPNYVTKKYLTMISLQYIKVKLHEHLTNQHMLGCVYYIWVIYWCVGSIIITLKINMVTTQDYIHWQW